MPWPFKYVDGFAVQNVGQASRIAFVDGSPVGGNAAQITLPSFLVSATLDLRETTADIHMPVFAVSAALVRKKNIVGAANLPSFTIAAALTRQKNILGGVGLLTPTVAATLTNTPYYTFNADFSAYAMGAVTTLPYGVSFSRSSAATVRTGASTVSGAISVDTARVGSDGTSSGLVFEEARTNSVPDSRAYGAASWSAGTATRTDNAAAGPDGAVLAEQFQITTTTGYTTYRSSTAGSIFSVWLRAVTGTQPYSMRVATPTFVAGTATTSWQRVKAATSNFFNEPSEWHALGALGPSNCYFDMAQVEAGAFATEFILTSGGTATRAGERLYAASAATVVTSGGQVRFEFKGYPKGSRSQYSAAIRLWTSGSDYAEINQTTGVLTVSINGSTNTTSALTWTADDLVEIWVLSGGSATTVVKYRVNGGTVNVPTITGSALGNVSTAGAFDALCNGTSNQLTARVQYARTYNTGNSPSWV